MYDAQGRQVAQGKVSDKGRMEWANVSAGLYQIEIEGQAARIKIMVLND
jgi:hypothetical protein